MKKIFGILLCAGLGLSSAWGADEKDPFAKFQQSVQITCEAPEGETQVEYPWIKDAKKIITPEKWKRIEDYHKDLPGYTEEGYPGIDAIAKVYKTNMNNLYSCGVVQVQKQALKNLEARIKGVASAPEVKKSFQPKLINAKKKLNQVKFKDTQGKTVSCINQGDQQTFIKLNILKQATYLTCEYDVYMQYAKDYYAQPKNVLESSTNGEGVQYSNVEVAHRLQGAQHHIQSEVDRAYQLFPLAYNAYSQYEHNVAAHLYLGLLREDFYVFRQELHNVLSPLNQVVYKISNAQKD